MIRLNKAGDFLEGFQPVIGAEDVVGPTGIGDDHFLRADCAVDGQLVLRRCCSNADVATLIYPHPFCWSGGTVRSGGEQYAAAHRRATPILRSHSTDNRPASSKSVSATVPPVKRQAAKHIPRSDCRT